MGAISAVLARGSFQIICFDTPALDISYLQLHRSNKVYIKFDSFFFFLVQQIPVEAKLIMAPPNQFTVNTVNAY